MPNKEASNIIIKLTKEGWDAEKINAFILYIETHTPTEEETQAIIERVNSN